MNIYFVRIFAKSLAFFAFLYVVRQITTGAFRDLYIVFLAYRKIAHSKFSDYIQGESTLNPNLKTFNMIMTTSNHPPFDAPVVDFSAPIEQIKSFVKSTPNFKRKAVSEKILAHIWWQDKVIAHFVREMSAKFPQSLFVITGDHYDREYPFESNAKITNAVPFIVYAPSLKLATRTKIGSHIDITPTIVELVAPKGFEYVSFGKSLLIADSMKNESLRGEAKAIYENTEFVLGFNAIANENFIYDGFSVDYFGDLKNADDKAKADTLFLQLKCANALSWWIIKNGYEIPANHTNITNLTNLANQ